MSGQCQHCAILGLSTMVWLSHVTKVWWKWDIFNQKLNVFKSHHDKRVYFPTTMLQYQFAITPLWRMNHLEECWCLICVQRSHPLPFLKHLSVAGINLLSGHHSSLVNKVLWWVILSTQYKQLSLWWFMFTLQVTFLLWFKKLNELMKNPRLVLFLLPFLPLRVYFLILEPLHNPQPPLPPRSHLTPNVWKLNYVMAIEWT